MISRGRERVRLALFLGVVTMLFGLTGEQPVLWAGEVSSQDRVEASCDDQSTILVAEATDHTGQGTG
jgi:hypothetical protein